MAFELTRREFLLVSAAVAPTVLSPAVLTAIGNGRLTPEERSALLTVARTLFRHDHVADSAYLKAVSAVEARCLGDASTRAIVTDGIARLQAACFGNLARAGSEKCVALLKAMDGSAFHRIVYRQTLEALYGSTEAWAIFRRPKN